MGLPRYSGKELTKFLRQLAMEADDLSPDGATITKAEKLAQILWKKALGFKEMVVADGGAREIVHAPEAWAIQLVYDRLEGKVGPTAVEEGGKLSAAERVSELARTRLNSFVGGSAVVSAAKPTPPKLNRKDKHGNS